MRFRSQSAEGHPDEETTIAVGASRQFLFDFSHHLSRHELSMVGISHELQSEKEIRVSGTQAVSGVYQWYAEGLLPGVVNMVIKMTTNDANRSPVAVVKLNVYDPKQV